MDPKNQPQFNPKIPLSEVLKQEQEGFVPSAPKINDVVNAIGDMYDSTKNLGAANAIPKTIPGDTSAPAQTSSVEEKNILPNNQVRIIKTYRSDANEAVKAQQESIAKIAIEEEKRRREREESAKSAPKKKFGLLLTAIILITLGVIAIPIVQYVLNQKKQEVAVNTEKAIVPFDHQDNLTMNNATRDNFIGVLDEFRAKPPVTANIEYLKFFEKVQDVNDKTKTISQQISSDTFAGLIGPNMPSALRRSFDSSYMYGLENPNGPKPFILLKTSSYQQTFANMLHWETKMLTDLNPVLNLNTNVFASPFTDKVVVNKDVRAITAQDGTIIFLYGFLDSQTLIITTDSQTFQDINNRYVAAQFVQ